MSRDLNHNKIEEICDFIIEVSKGNFTLQLNPKGAGELEPLVMLHNMMNEELNTLFHQTHSGKSAPKIVLFSFILNQDLDIKFISPKATKFLGNEIAFKNIQDILSKNSFTKLQKYLESGDRQVINSKLKLDFENSSGLLIKTKAEVHWLQAGSENSVILINATRLSYENKRLKKHQNNIGSSRIKYPTRNRSILLQENREMIERLQKYLLKNIDKEFPGIKGLSKIFNASESKLKKGFKYYYGTSIYKFVKEKRLEKAHLLLTETEKPISAIAQDCGFISAAHFSRSFKEKFGYRPSDIQRKPE